MRKLLFLSALCVGLSGISHADSSFYLVNNTYGTIDPVTFQLTAVTGSAVGTVNIDKVSGNVDSLNITVTNLGIDYVFTGAPTGQDIDSTGTMYFEYSYDALGDILLLDFPMTSLVGYSGSTLCAYDSFCMVGNDKYAGYFGLADGVTDFAAVTGALAATPEPSSLILLSTGLLATVGAVRRRVFSPQA